MPKNNLIVAAAIQKGDVIRPDYYYYSGLTVTSEPELIGNSISFKARVIHSDVWKSPESLFSIYRSAPVVLIERSGEAR